MNENSENVKNFFHSYASDFNSIYGRTGKANFFQKTIDRLFRKVMFERMIETFKDLSGNEIKTILDIGCGPGRYSAHFMKLGKDILAIDIAQGMLDIAKDTTRSIETGSIQFILANYLEHNFENKIDGACLMGLLDYIDDPLSLLKKLNKEISKTICISFPKSRGALAFQRKIRYFLRSCPLYLYSKSEIEDLLKNAGFSGKYTIKDLGRDYYVKISI
jgi:ubiquinone/menaquinone biosynthesis C-methylase UbiE